MSIATALLNPKRFESGSTDDIRILTENVTRLIALLAEDAATAGVLAPALEQAVEQLGGRLQLRLIQSFDNVRDRLQTALSGIRDFIESRGGLAAEVADDPAAAITFLRQLIADLQLIIDGISLNGVRQALQFVLDLLQQDLCLTDTELKNQMRQFFDDVIGHWQTLAAGQQGAEKQRTHTAISIVRGIRNRLISEVEIPEFDLDDWAKSLYRMLTDSGITRFSERIGCYLDKIEEVANATGDLSDIFESAARPGSAAGSDVTSGDGQVEYAWYATWLLQDEDQPLLSPGCIKNPAALFTRLKERQDTLSDYLYIRLPQASTDALDTWSGGPPPAESLLAVIAGINEIMQGEAIYADNRFDGISLNSDLRDLEQGYESGRCLLLFNREFLAAQFAEIEEADWASTRWWKSVTGFHALRVYVTADKRYIMIDDCPMKVGSNLKWNDAPVFSSRIKGQLFYTFEVFDADACETWAWLWGWGGMAIRSTLQFVNTPPQHVFANVFTGFYEAFETLVRLIGCRPLKGIEPFVLGQILDSDLYGPKPLALLGGSFFDMHSDATGDNIAAYWLTAFLGDVFRHLEPRFIMVAAEDLWLSGMTLLNTRTGFDFSTLENPPANYLKVAPLRSLGNFAFGYLHMAMIGRDEYSINIWDKGDIGDTRLKVFLGVWFGGSILVGFMSGMMSFVVAMLFSRVNDPLLFAKNIGLEMAIFALKFWLNYYLNKEGDTDGGRYGNTDGDIRRYKGYPENEDSPYKLPYPAGQVKYMGQGNQGLFSHNHITNLTSNWQTYAFDFAFDHGVEVLAMRGGEVYRVKEDEENNSEDAANFIIIKHTDTVPDHDDPEGKGTPVVTYARYVHGAKNGVSDLLGTVSSIVSPADDDAGNPIPTTEVVQGQPIMRADDTGTSFHSHLHIYIALEDGSAPGSDSIPFVFDDVGGDGVPKFLNWYRSSNEQVGGN